MPHSALLELSRDVDLGTVWVQTDSQYVAVRSKSLDAVPCIKWTILRAVSGNKSKTAEVLTVNPKEFGLSYLKPNTLLLWQPVSPVNLTRIVLSASPSAYPALDESKDTIRERLPPFVKAGTFIESLGCYVKACEPSDEGVVPSDGESLSISVVESADQFQANGLNTDSGIDVQLFLESDAAHTLELNVSTLARPMPISSIMPPAPDYIDTENLAFVKLPELAKLGIFSGDLVKLESDGQSRLVFLYSFPDSGHARDHTLYMSPLLMYNMGSPNKIKVTAVSSEGEPFEAARDVTLSRVSSPASTDKANQSAFLRGLKSYFGNGRVRVVKNNDLVPVPINASLARLLGNPPSSVNGANGHAGDDADSILQSLYDTPTDESSDASHADTMIWFQVGGLPTDSEYLISSSHTRMVQSGLVQRQAPPASLRWQSYWGLPARFPYLAADQKQFEYAHTLHRLLRACLTPRGAALKTTILLKSSKPGAGKSSVLQSVAEELGIHEMALDSLDLIKDSDAKTLGLLKARLERASSTSPCLVSIRHFDALAKKNDVDGKDTPLVNGLLDILDDMLSINNPNSFIFAVTVRDPDAIAESIRNKFKFEIDVSVPTERERRAIFGYLTSVEGGFSNLGQLVPKMESEVFTGFALRGDVSIDALALQSAGLNPPDLCAIIKTSKQLACTRHTQDMVLSCGGSIKVSPQDLEEAIREARDKFSDSIGAPKIPNVGWKDVGGLDMVKGEILDTIDMPLKHPELFASGLKKRSGILFYGPPGTGKTLLAKAIATNFSLNFFSVKGPELLNMYIGESEANVRRVFQKARDAKPCVIFFDELDSVAPKRGNKGDSGGVMDRIVSQLLAELDGMSEGSDGVFVVGATNRPDLLDEALLRPGRFDKMLYLGISDTHEKQRKILEALTRKFELDPEVSLATVAEKCPYTYTGADFYAMSSDAMLNAMTRTAGEVDAKISQYNAEHPESPVTIRRWFQDIAVPDDVKVRVSSADFDKAQRELVPSVSADELAHYLKVRNTFEGKG